MSVQQVTFEVTTTSEVIQSWNTPANPPQITIDGNPLPAPGNQAYTASGWQVVVFDQTKDLTQPASIVSNFYIPLQQENGSWVGYYQYMYTQMVKQFLMSGNPGTQIVIAATYGLDLNVPPTSDGIASLFSYGAGPQLQAWEVAAVDAGSEGGDWTGFPVNYILIGASALGYGGGTEAYEAATSAQQIQTQISAQFGNPGANAGA